MSLFFHIRWSAPLDISLSPVSKSSVVIYLDGFTIQSKMQPVPLGVCIIQINLNIQQSVNNKILIVWLPKHTQIQSKQLEFYWAVCITREKFKIVDMISRKCQIKKKDISNFLFIQFCLVDCFCFVTFPSFSVLLFTVKASRQK